MAFTIRQLCWRRITTRVLTLAGMAALALLALAVSAQGEARYSAVQCYPGPGGQSPGSATYTESAPAGHDAACYGDGLGIYFPSRTSNGRVGQWTISAPAGAYFSYISLFSRRNAAKGWRPRTVAVGTDDSTTYLRGYGDGQWHPAWTLGSFKAVGSKLVCRGARNARPTREGGAKPCFGSWGAYVFARQFELTVRDPTPPTVSRLGGSLLSSGNRSGIQTVTATATDEGGGVRQLFLRVNGTRTAIKTYSCDLVRPERDLVAVQLTPCPLARSDVLSVNTAAAPFRTGFNSVQVCAADYSDATDPKFGANVTCSSPRLISVGSTPSNVPPSPPPPRPSPPPPPPSPPPPPTAGCPLSQAGADAQMAMLGCQLVASDTASAVSPLGFWGYAACQNSSRVQHVPSGGDPHLTGIGVPQLNSAYRRLSVFDGDNPSDWGERCELGENDHRGPTAFYREGQRRATFASIRLPANFPLEANTWQNVLQMKQAQPSDAGGETPILYMGAFQNQWWIDSSNGVYWTFPARRNVWTRFIFDVTYSRDPSRGLLQVSADLNADGDVADAGERTARIRTNTLKTETAGPNGGSDGLNPGDSIPSHLRIGIYHNPSIPCGSGGCSTEVDNVQVVKAPGAP